MPSSSSKKAKTHNFSLFEKKLKIKFKNSKLLEEALTHKSYAIEQGKAACNERLEFLGDSVIASVVAHYLFEKYPSVDEGKLSKMKSQIVSRANLSQWANELQFAPYLLLSQGEEATGGRKRDTLLGNAYEALVGAMFLDQGYSSAEKFILRQLSKKRRIVETDFKSRLQELIQKKFKIPPTYRTTKEVGPDHAKRFTLEVHVNDQKMGTGEGRSKKEAEQSAAKEALKFLKTHKIHK